MPLTGIVGDNIPITFQLPFLGTSPGVTITPSDGTGGGSFSPPTIMLTTATPTATCNYIPGSSGTKTIHTINDRGLADPPDLQCAIAIPWIPTDATVPCLRWYRVGDLAGLSNNDPVNSWTDVTGHVNATPQHSAPLYKISGAEAWVEFAGGASQQDLFGGNTGLGAPVTVVVIGESASCYWHYSGAVVGCVPQGFIWGGSAGLSGTTDCSTAFHCLIYNLGEVYNQGWIVVDGAMEANGVCGTSILANILMMYDGSSNWYAGKMKEYIYFNGRLTPADRLNMAAYARRTYGTP